jgi:hypothetical protein
MNSTALFLGFLVLWIVLNRWVLPRFGIPTCMSGGCTASSCPSCVPEPSNYGDKDFTQPKENQS